MQKIKLIKYILPHIILDIFRRNTYEYGYSGNFSSWEEATKASTGYDSDVIFNKVKNALLEVKEGRAVYERDSVIFEKIQYSWPPLAGLLWIASKNGNKLNVCDFGGSLGSTYYQNKNFLSHLYELRWSIVEQRKFVEYGKQFFENENRKFYFSLDDCIIEKSPDTLLLLSVIQYLENPYDLLKEIINKRFKYIIFDRTPFLEKGDDRITIQNVPPEIYNARYPAWFFNLEKFLNCFADNYELISDFESNDRANIAATFKGFIFRSK